MAELPGPYEIFELSDGESYEMKVERWESGEVTIHPAFKPEGKVISALRVYVNQHYKPLFPWYWDITSQTLIAQLIPYLEAPGWGDKLFRVTKYGVAPRARFQLVVK